jgi:tRNA-specific 2-thiouridylase
VLERDAETGRVVVGPKDELATTRVALEDARLHRPAGDVRSVRLRYHARPLACTVHSAGDGRLIVDLAEPAHAIAPGQLACLMHEDAVVGYGTIGDPL